MKVVLVYFSATGNTATIAKTVKRTLEELHNEVAEFDITAFSSRQGKIDLDPYQAVIFGMPVHSYRAPRIVREWLQTLDGKGKKCSIFFTYGGCGIHPSHYSTKQILEQQHFVPVSSAEFLGAHTFNLSGWKAMEGRPDHSDFDVAKEYVFQTYKRFIGEDSGRLGDLEQAQYTEKELDDFENLRFMAVTQLPTRGGKDCTRCMTCEESCPTGAMDAETGQAEQGKCIACLGCVANCPDNALMINDLSKFWAMEMEMEGITEESLKEKKSKIYL